ncbi:hypothetical protein GIB67_005218 [Kingdonia uniflora]|uniref:PB1 domain-containing protein n=1 Tax=Kingdonia uniflora TaxID=39325 RepID=A0A7J7NN70_9MAGN|nr:hypothetical protein GIB67_005218 [Kingdonia uniflora]
MGKPSGKKNNTLGERSPKVFDNDTVTFISMSQDLKDEGNKLFQKRDHEGAMLKYEKALNLLPRNHIDVAYLRSNMAACFMQMSIGEYPRAINECNLALQVSPKYSKALLKRAKCYEALNRLDLAYRDVDLVLKTEPNNLTGLEIAGRVKNALEKKGVKVDDEGFSLVDEYLDPPCASSPPSRRIVRERSRKKRNTKAIEEKKAEDKVVVQENVVTIKEEEPPRTVKLVLGGDIRWAQLLANCTIQEAREIVHIRFPSLRAFLIKYKDQEGDLVTITSTEELRWAEASAEPQGSIRLYVVDVNPGQEPFLEGMNCEPNFLDLKKNQANATSNGNSEKSGEIENGHSSYVDDWIIQFARLFKNHVGFDSEAYLDLHEVGMKLHSDAIEDTISSEKAQDLFEMASEKFQEMAALALFNWGNVHMSKARKSVVLADNVSRETVLTQAKTAYEWARNEYVKAGIRYEEALNIKPDFYESLLALGQQQFEQARLSWYYAIGSKVELETWPSMEKVFQLFNNAEANMEKGMTMWEDIEGQRLKELSKPDRGTPRLQKMGLYGVFNGIFADEAAERAANMRSQINLLWGTILYERSIVDYKLGLLVWEECLEVAVEKFELAGASPTDMAVMIKNHCANRTSFEGLGFKIDEIVQAWNEMYDAKRWKTGVPSFRLEPLLRRRIPQLHYILEHV